mmetsp:Transcript_46426/g.97118  ORF Transcript_46426/g.97118 Transcript_46426/m.97118 type:complete len:99 (+) Transcript_46426:55-351(+)
MSLQLPAYSITLWVCMCLITFNDTSTQHLSNMFVHVQLQRIMMVQVQVASRYIVFPKFSTSNMCVQMERSSWLENFQYFFQILVNHDLHCSHHCTSVA